MSSIKTRLAELQSAPRPDLLDHWQGCFGSPVPSNLSSKLIRRAVCHQLQMSEFGGLPCALAKQLKGAFENELKDVKTPFTPLPVQLKTGTRLLREWNGRSYEVDVIDNGFIWNNNTYKSLSAIAQEITGAHWSGPRFFGLTGRHHKNQQGAQ